jgi:drug/metabolite transporter (DMT)-like permease
MGTFFYTKALSYIQYIDLSVVVLLQKLQPLFAISLAAIILKEKITQKFLLLAGAEDIWLPLAPTPWRTGMKKHSSLPC